jgi:copper transport protein
MEMKYGWNAGTMFPLWLVVLAPVLVLAHAIPRTTLPMANAVLDEAPREVTVRFSERVEAGASSLQVFDAQGMRVDDGEAVVVSGDPWLYRVMLRPVGNGVYTVSWRVMSADDGHVTDGAYVFAVGSTGILLPAKPGRASAVTGWGDALDRWLGMLGAVMLIGMLTASCVFWRQALPHVPPPLYVLPWLAIQLVAAGYTLFARLLQLPVEGNGWVDLGRLMSSGIGQIAAAKVGIAMLLIGTLAGYWWGSRGRTWCWALAVLLTGLLLVSDAFVSHSAAIVGGRGLAMGAQLAHLLGVALWVGGLGYFATLFWWSTFREPSTARELAWAIPAFSMLAVGAVGLLTVSGLYLAQLHLGTVDQILSSPYGRILLAKLGLAALMLAMGVYHQFIVAPRILASLGEANSREDRHSRRFRSTVRLEAVVGGVALLVAAVLGTTSPPSGSPPRVEDTFRQVHTVNDTQLVVEVKPLRPGPNQIRLTVSGRDGQPLVDATAALLRLQVEGSDTAPLGIKLDRESAGVFVKQGTVLGIAGKWQGQVTVQRQGAYDLSERFELTLTGWPDQQVTVASSRTVAPSTTLIYLGIVAVTVGLVFMSKRRLSAALRRLDAKNHDSAPHSDRRSNDAD